MWRIEDAITRIKRLIAESVDQWNLRLSESTKKRDSDKKREKSITIDLESPSAVEAHPLLPDGYEANSVSDTQVGEHVPSSGMTAKKIRSLDQGIIFIMVC